MINIESKAISHWANTNQRTCSQVLPDLIRRLIQTTSPQVRRIIFPSGDAISEPGWDGRLDADGHAFVPNGESGWEISAQSDPKRKAESDYRKRSKDPLDLDPASGTFVFVTPRNWRGRHEWAREKCRDRIFHDVRVIGACEIQQWLNDTPNVGIWLAQHLGILPPIGVQCIEHRWREWATATMPPFTEQLVIAGREQARLSIQEWLRGDPRIISVQGDVTDEATAFLYAAIATQDEPERSRNLGRCLAVDSLEVLRSIQVISSPLILAISGQFSGAAASAVSSGHHVFVATDACSPEGTNAIRLQRPQAEHVEQALVDCSLNKTKARGLARDCGRSIPALRRQISISGAIQQPPWASANSAQVLIPALLAGSWSDSAPGDRKVLAEISGQTYEELTNRMAEYLLIADPPLQKLGEVWTLVSPIDAWFLMSRYILHPLLDRYRTTFLGVLAETNPKYELPADQRWAAGMYGKISDYSSWLRGGMVEALVLGAVFGTNPKYTVSMQAFADDIAHRLLEPAKSWQAWASLNDLIPSLAEAAPDTFLDVLEHKLSTSPELFIGLLCDDGQTLFGECRHSGLLWGLESIAWSPAHFGRAVAILGALAKIDPGGRWGNRPGQSLHGVFLPDIPQTNASSQQRLEAFDRLTQTCPKIVWSFTYEYFCRGWLTPSHRFSWRDSEGREPSDNCDQTEDQADYITGILERLKQLATNKANLANSCEHFLQLSPLIQPAVLEHLEALDPERTDPAQKLLIWTHVRRALHYLNRRADEAVSPHVSRLLRIYSKFEPEALPDRLQWLLSSPWPDLPFGYDRDYATHEMMVQTAQRDAARQLLDGYPLDKLMDFAATMDYPGVFARALGMATRDDSEDASTFDSLLGHETLSPILVINYAASKTSLQGQAWIDQQINRLKSLGKSAPEICAWLYLGLPEGTRTWTTVANAGPQVEQEYWKRTPAYIQSNDPACVQMAIEKLLQVSRTEEAVRVAGSCDVKLGSQLIIRTLRSLTDTATEAQQARDPSMQVYYIGRILNQLHACNDLSEEEIAQIEWPFAPLFDDLRNDLAKPLAIHRVLQRDPALFAQVVSWRYKPDDPALEAAASSQVTDLRSRASLLVLSSWKLLPGQMPDGTVDERVLISWVETARKECAKGTYITGGDLELARILACSPPDPDGDWPHTAVRNLIESLANPLIEDRIKHELFNSRGTVCKAIFEGGEQERQLGSRYLTMSERLQSRWPRTASMLRRFGQRYIDDASREDIRTEQDRVRWT